MIGAMFHAVTGRPAESDLWAAAAELGHPERALADGSASIESWRAVLRACRGERGVEAMRADATLAVSTLAPTSPWRPPATVLLGVSQLLSGRADDADDTFSQAGEQAASLGAADMAPVAGAERALVAIGRDEWVRADALAQEAVWRAQHSRLADHPLNSLAYAVAARTALALQRTANACELLTRAQRHLPQLTYVLPVPAVQTRLEMAETYLKLADHVGVRTVLREAEALLRRRPDLGTLPQQAQALRGRAGTSGQATLGASALSAAELRVLPLLTTHLTFKEIANRQYLSPHTVKSHAMSIYRKLGATTRGEAVQRARDVGLL